MDRGSIWIKEPEINGIIPIRIIVEIAVKGIPVI